MKIAIIDTANLFKVKKRNTTTNRNGAPCGGVVGVAHAILLMRSEGYVPVCALEGKNSTAWRRSIIKTYKKGHGSAKPRGDLDPEADNTRWQWQAMLTLLELLKVPMLFAQGKEGDDVIAFLTHLALNNKKIKEVRIVSNDRDFHRLLSRSGKVRLTSSINTQESLTWGKFIRKHGYSPALTIWYKIMVGDPSDGIKGIPRIGIVKAKKIVTAMHKRGINPQSIDEFLEWTADHPSVLPRGAAEILDTNHQLISPLFKVLSLDYNLVAARMKLCCEMQPRAGNLSEIAIWFRKYQIDVKPETFTSARYCKASPELVNQLAYQQVSML